MNKLTNCINCGAPLDGPVCPYCGTRYERDNKFKSSPFDYSMMGEINFNGETVRVYISEVEFNYLDGPGAGRDLSGRLIRCPIGMKRKFTMVEI